MHAEYPHRTGKSDGAQVLVAAGTTTASPCIQYERHRVSFRVAQKPDTCTIPAQPCTRAYLRFSTSPFTMDGTVSYYLFACKYVVSVMYSEYCTVLQCSKYISSQYTVSNAIVNVLSTEYCTRVRYYSRHNCIIEYRRS